MPVTLTAANVPAPVVNSTLELVADAYNSLGTDGPNVLYNLIQGATTFASKWNANMKALELIGRGGCGTYCILNGLALSDGGGLDVDVAAGQALIDGVVEIQATSITVPDETARVFIWLKQDGTLTYATNTSVPSGGKVLLGSCETGSGAITSLDTSGVLYSRGGLAIRETADTGVPGDTPGNVVFLTKATSGMYMWNGSAYTLMFTNSQLTEYVQDAVGAMFTNTTGLTWTYDDGTGAVEAEIDLTAFDTDSLPEGVGNLYYSDDKVTTAIAAGHLLFPYSAYTTTANVTLTTASHNIQAVEASGGNRDVFIPASPSYGHWFKIMNTGSSNSLIVKVSGSTAALVTITTAQQAIIAPQPVSGSAGWPTAVTATGYGGMGGGL